ncbi:MAG TPA: prephenate dehydrogenase [Limnochordia bacterium]
MEVAILGLGLIGGSLGMALRRPGAAERSYRVRGIARRAATLEEAAAVGAIDSGTLDPAEGVRGADVVVICTPVSAIISTLSTIAPHVSEHAVITDVGSTKREICAAAWELLPERPLFIGGHPLAGSERGGVLAADPYLFQNAVYVLTPPPRRPGAEDGMQRLLALVRHIGADPLVLDPERHDRIVAAVSHLPHLVAAALVQTVVQASLEEPITLNLAAGGFRDTTRIASGPPDVWRDICLSNAGALLAALDRFQESLAAFKEAIAAGRAGELERLLSAAREGRGQIPLRAKGLLAPLWELVVQVPDRPGVLHAVTGILAEAQINIIDIEILRVREGEGGTLRLAVESPQALQRAVDLLVAAGYSARARG